MRHVQLTINVPEADIIDLKIISGSLVGTLHIEKQGLSFSPPKAKKAPQHRVNWSKLPHLIALSNGFPFARLR